MTKAKQGFILMLAFAVTAAIIAYQQSAISNLRDNLVVLDAKQTSRIQKEEYSQQRQQKRDAHRAMRAICVLGAFAQMDRPAGPGQMQTIRSAEFELLYFAQQYLTDLVKGRPMADLLLSSEVDWTIRGEYYSSLQAVSISLEAAKNSTLSQIPPEGNVRHLLERISRWLNKRSQNNAAEQGDGKKTNE
jgi:hypothetical protein